VKYNRFIVVQVNLTIEKPDVTRTHLQTLRGDMRYDNVFKPTKYSMYNYLKMFCSSLTAYRCMKL